MGSGLLREGVASFLIWDVKSWKKTRELAPSKRFSQDQHLHSYNQNGGVQPTCYDISARKYGSTESEIVIRIVFGSDVNMTGILCD